MQMASNDSVFKVLSLDGGGSKGVYSLGVLKEMERHVGSPLSKYFSLVYGTSTGSIIAALIALGWKIDDIYDLYLEHIPKIMGQKSSHCKSKQLERCTNEVFGDKRFESFSESTMIGIVALNFDKQRPTIFKSSTLQMFDKNYNKKGVVPGFGCMISDAVQASCSAYPIFEKKRIYPINMDSFEAVDGGFIANDPSFYALNDAENVLGDEIKRLRILSVGTGIYDYKSIGFKDRLFKRFNIYSFVEKIIRSSSNTNQQLMKIIYPKIHVIRVEDKYEGENFKTNMVEKNIKKLKKMNNDGRGSFKKMSKEILDGMI